MYDLITAEVEVRQGEIDAQNALLSTYQDQRNAIQEKLDFKKFLGDDLYNEFLTYRKETTYKNTNYNTDNTINANGTYDNGKIIQRAKEFYNKAKKDAVKSGEYQFSISTNLYNLLLIEGFEPLLNDFDLGNFIRVRVDEEVYRLRLIKYEINFGDLSRLNTEFSNFTKTADGMNDIQSVLSQAQQMGKSYDYVQTQATNGERAAYTIEEYRLSGLDSAYYKIMNNNNEEVTMDSRGIIARAYDDVTDNYDPKQLRITHNILAFTHDNWKTVDCALGNFTYWDQDINKHEDQYGLNANFVIGGFIAGTTMMAGDLYSMGHVNPTHVNNGGVGVNGYQITKGFENRISDTAISYYVSDDGMSILTGNAISKDFPHMTHINLTNGDFNFGHGTFWFDAASRTLNLNGGIFNAGTINASTINGVHIFGSDIHGTYIYGSHFYGGDLHIGAIGGISKDSKYHFNVKSDGTLTIGDAPNTNSHWPNKYPFEVDPDGSMYATNGHFSGIIYGSHFRGGDIYIGNGFETEDAMTPFHVNSNGEMWATNGHFKGIIEAAGIYIGKNSSSKSGYNFSVYKTGNAPSDYVGETKDGYLTSIYGRLSTFTYDDKQIAYHKDGVDIGFGIVSSLSETTPGLTMTQTSVGTSLIQPGEFFITSNTKTDGIRLQIKAIDVTKTTSDIEIEDADLNESNKWFTLITNGDMACGHSDNKASMVATRRWVKNKAGITSEDPKYATNDFTLATRDWVKGNTIPTSKLSSAAWNDPSVEDKSYTVATRMFIRHLAAYDDDTRMDSDSKTHTDYQLATTDYVNAKINKLREELR